MTPFKLHTACSMKNMSLELLGKYYFLRLLKAMQRETEFTFFNFKTILIPLLSHEQEAGTQTQTLRCETPASHPGGPDICPSTS